MARKLINKETVRCACRQCGTSAILERYDCGCVRVQIINDSRRGSTCTNFSGMKYTAPGCR